MRTLRRSTPVSLNALASIVVVQKAILDSPLKPVCVALLPFLRPFLPLEPP